MASDRRVAKAANELEEIALLAKTMSNDLRGGADNPYGRVYWLRARLGRTVAQLGQGVPTGLQAITEHYEDAIQKD